jgi:flagellar motor switch protein FliN/FliY
MSDSDIKNSNIPNDAGDDASQAKKSVEKSVKTEKTQVTEAQEPLQVTAESKQPPSQTEKTVAAEAKKLKTPEDFDLDLLLDIPLEIKVELGRTRIKIQKLLNLAPGSAIKLIKLEGEPVDILVNDTLIARGDVVVQNEKYGIRVTEITSRLDRIRSFSI